MFLGQNYFTKAALIILHSRVALPPAYSKDSKVRRINKWVSEFQQIGGRYGLMFYTNFSVHSLTSKLMRLISLEMISVGGKILTPLIIGLLL